MQISSEQIQGKMDESFGMTLRGSDAAVVEKVVNMGIDSHLEACYVPSRGDSYSKEGSSLFCIVSAKSLPTLVRRLTEMEGDDADVAYSLATAILSSLEFNVETACFEVV